MAANPMVTYICKRTVVSTTPVQPGKHHSLSVLDRVMGQNLLKMVYYLKTPPAVDRYNYEPGEITKNLRESLSETLTLFPVITGRLVKEEDGRTWMVKCNDAGVRMVEARAQGSVEEWLDNVDREKEMKLVHWEETFHNPYFWSTFYVQLTEFEGGGVAIGLSCYHLLADPVCAAMFVKAWADMSSLGKLQNPPFFHALPTPKLAHNTNKTNDLTEHYKGTTVSVSNTVIDENAEMASHVATLSFSFSDSMVQSCIAMAADQQSGESTTPRQASPFEALSGLFWVCLSKIKGDSDRGLMEMSICLDARRVLGLDSGFFGNCMVHNRVRGSDHDDKPSSMSSLPGSVAAVREAVGEIMNRDSVMGLIEWLRCEGHGHDEDEDQQKCPSPINHHGECELVCIGLDGMDPYAVRFGDGFEPIRVSSYVEPVGEKWHVLILPAAAPRADSAGGGGKGQLGRVVMVTIPKEFVGSLCRNELIRDLCPDIVMGKNCGDLV